ncbi:hypothetical protein BU17DRAFT_62827 [Hysterangium stoloniferum]|nr:hypothetical protein BU17DRAFT_62827 [Hysterangium stoloniferum]
MAKLGKIKVWMLVPEYSKICGLDFNERYGCVMKWDVIWNCISSGALKDQQYHNLMKVWNQQPEVFQEPRKETGIVNGQGVDRQGEAPTFNPRDIPDLNMALSWVVLVTGDDTGIGYCTLLLKNVKVVLDLDLGDSKSVKRAAIEYLTPTNTPLSLSCSGVVVPPVEFLTTQGCDLRTNVLGHYYLTVSLSHQKRQLRGDHALSTKTFCFQHFANLRPSMERKPALFNTSSHGHVYAPENGIDWTVLKSSPRRDETIRKWGPSWVKTGRNMGTL